MRREELHPIPAADLVLRSPTNWTAVIFIGLLSVLHLGVAIPAFLRGIREGYLSLGLGLLFAAVAAGVAMVRADVIILAHERRVVVRNSLLWYRLERSRPFETFNGVRVTLLPGGDDEARIELLSTDGDVECPPTSIPRQEALLLAMTINVPLIRVSERDELEEEHATPDDNERPTRRLP